MVGSVGGGEGPTARCAASHRAWCHAAGAPVASLVRRQGVRGPSWTTCLPAHQRLIKGELVRCVLQHRGAFLQRGADARRLVAQRGPHHGRPRAQLGANRQCFITRRPAGRQGGRVAAVPGGNARGVPYPFRQLQEAR